MNLEEIRTFRNAQPFQPFVMSLTDGRAIAVDQKFRLGIAPWGRIGVYEGAKFHLLAPAEIVEIRPVVSAAK